MKPRLHVCALPHTTTTKEFVPCAYTMKVYNFCRFMTQKGYEVIHYGTEGSDVLCEHVSVITQAEQEKMVPLGDWKSNFFAIEWFPELPYWQLHNYRCAQEILRRKSGNDYLCLIGGGCQQPIAQMVPDIPAVEWGIGYSGVFADFRVFESYAWMHSVITQQAGNSFAANGRNYDVVIPNSFDPGDFTMGHGDGGFLLYIGRLIQRKGVQVAVEAAKAAEMPLVLAGQGGKVEDGRLHFDGTSVPYENMDYIGTVDVAKRNHLMGSATAVLVPTVYLGPFEGVNVEAQFTGTPVVTTDWGAFCETVEQGRTGYRCHTLREFRDGILAAGSLDRTYIRDRAHRLYSLDAAAEQYDRYFERLQDLKRGGWYELGGSE